MRADDVSACTRSSDQDPDLVMSRNLSNDGNGLLQSPFNLVGASYVHFQHARKSLAGTFGSAGRAVNWFGPVSVHRFADPCASRRVSAVRLSQ